MTLLPGSIYILANDFAGIQNIHVYLNAANKYYHMTNNMVIEKNEENKLELKIGTHLSVAKGYAALAKDAVRIGANTFQLFIRNPRGARAKEIKQDEIDEFQNILQKHDFTSFIAHAPYTLNLCSSSGHLRELSAQAAIYPGNTY